MENTPKISVIINGLNSQDYLKEALDSVFAQTYKKWEIIFWDNASTDRTPQIAESYGPQLKYFRSDKTYPLGKARNMAIQKAAGDFIAFLDSDDIWLPEKLEEQISIFKKDNEIGLVFSDVMYFNKNGDVFSAYKNKKPSVGWVFKKLLKKNFLCASSVIIRGDALSKLEEWFDERFTGIEDWDLFLRISHDWKIAGVDKVLVKYRMHEKSWTNLNQSAFPMEQKLMIKKFLNLYPNFAKNYRCELKFLRLRGGCQKIILFFSRFFPKSFYAFMLRLFKIKNYSS